MNLNLNKNDNLIKHIQEIEEAIIWHKQFDRYKDRRSKEFNIKFDKELMKKQKEIKILNFILKKYYYVLKI